MQSKKIYKMFKISDTFLNRIKASKHLNSNDFSLLICYRVLKKAVTLNFLVGLDVKLVFFMHLLADFRVGQSDLVVEVRGCGSDQKKEEAHDQQGRAEAQTQRVIWLMVGKEEEHESDAFKLFSSGFTGLDESPSVRPDKRARVNKPLFCTASLSSPASALRRHHVGQGPQLGAVPGEAQQHHVQVLVGHGHAAGGALVHRLVLGPAAADVGAEQGGVVVGVGHGEGARAVAVVDVRRAGGHGDPVQGHGEAPQAAVPGPGGAVGVGPGAPRRPLRLVGTAHRLQGLQQQEGPVLALSWRQGTGLVILEQ